RIDGDPPRANAAAAYPRQRDPDQRARASAGQVVQSAARIRISYPRRGHARYLRAYGDPAPLRPDRAAARPVRARALWTRPQGPDGSRGASGRGTARPGLALSRSRSFSRATAVWYHGGPSIEAPSMRRRLLAFLSALCFLLLPVVVGVAGRLAAV